jgi:hypothetical protein
MARALEQLGVGKRIVDLIFRTFPNSSFEPFFPLLRKAVQKPTILNSTILEFQTQTGLGVTSHIAIAAREILGSACFPALTRDYVRRCCDLVEFFVKSRLLHEAGSEIERKMLQKPLGAIINELGRKHYVHSSASASDLLGKLEAFNLDVYRQAKHDYLNSGDKLFSVPDAVAVTFISIRLCHYIEEFCRHR